MTPQQTLSQVNSLIEALVGLSLSDDQNYPSTSGSFSSQFEISIGSATRTSIALKNVPYRDIYDELVRERCFNAKMLDGALLLLRYRFRAGAVCEHSLSFFPAADLAHFQNEPDIYLEDEIYADVTAKNIVPFPIRFDFNDSNESFVDVDHPYSHLTLGQYENCRIPVCSPVSPLTFGSFILRNFYNTAFRKYSRDIPSCALTIAPTITPNERQIPHVFFGA